MPATFSNLDASSQAGTDTKVTQKAHVTGDFTSIATSGTEAVTRTSDYGTEYDLDMQATKDSTPTGILGYYVDPSMADLIEGKGAIEGAVSVAQSGDTINAASGSYTDNLLQSSFENIKLVGAGADTTHTASFTLNNPLNGMITGITGDVVNVVDPNAKIQDGVDLVTQDGLVNVGAGEYDEYVNIYKDLTLKGTGDPTANSCSLTNGAILGTGSGGITALKTIVNEGSKIQDGITLVSENGEVDVNAGTYDEDVDINKDLTLIGINDPTATSFTLNAKLGTGSGGITAPTVNVNPVGRIQDGITLASSGGTVNVADGTYYENVQIDKSLTVNGAGAGSTIVDGNQAGSVITIFPTTEVALSGMTVQNGNSEKGGGIFNNGELTVTDSTISGNTANYGGGVYNLGTLNAANCEISNNNAAQEGGAIYNYGAATVTGSNILGNNAGVGGGLFNWQGRIVVDNTNIANNFAGYGGGGVFNYDILELRNSLVTKNTATWGGGVSNVGEANIEGSSISKNTAMQNGGGINNEGAVTVTGNTISENTAVNGGGIFNKGTVNMDGNSITGNTASNGVGIASSGNVILNSPLGAIDPSYSDTVTVNSGAKIQDGVNLVSTAGTVNVAAGTYYENVQIDKSLTMNGAGADNTIVNGDTDGDGIGDGSVFTIGSVTNRNLDVALTGLTITGGTGTSISVRDNDASNYISGGGILNYGKLTVTNTDISKNTAYYGAGVFNKGTLNLNSGTSINQNKAYDGGGIYNQGGAGSLALVNLNGCSIEDNEAEQRGAGIYSAGNTVNMYSGTTISGNIAHNSGAGIYLAPSGYVFNMYGGNIFDNHAIFRGMGASGGGIYSYGGNVHLMGGNIYANTAQNGAGAVNAGGNMFLEGARIYGNTANNVDYNYGYGGGIMNSGTLTLTSGSIDHNVAYTDGGGVWNNVAGSVSGNRLLVFDNTLINSGASDNISP